MGRLLLSRAVHGLQIGQLAAPDRRRVLSAPARTGKKGRLDELAFIADHQPVRGLYQGLRAFSLRRRGGGGVLPALAAARGGADRRFAVPGMRAVPQGVGPAGDSLGLQGLVGEGEGHFRQDHPGQIVVQRHPDRLSVPQNRQQEALVEALLRLQGRFCDDGGGRRRAVGTGRGRGLRPAVRGADGSERRDSFHACQTGISGAQHRQKRPK